MHNVYAFGDIHGQWRLYETIINYCKQQDPECCIVFLGDACDRGPDGYKIMQHLLSDPQIIYLMGNHERLFIDACDAIIGHHASDDEKYNKLHNYNKEEATTFIHQFQSNSDVNLHCANGGDITLIDWLVNGADEDIIDKLRVLPYTFSYENIDFCHAGATYNVFEEVANAEYNNMYIHYTAEYSLLWNRTSIPLGWKTGRICVHGHTPTIYLPDKAYGSHNKPLASIHPACWGDMMGAKDKRGGKKIDMDTAAAFTGRAFVLDVLTMKVIGFFDPRVIGENGEIKQVEEYKIDC